MTVEGAPLQSEGAFGASASLRSQSKFLVPVLSDLTSNDYTIENSFSFCRNLKNIPHSDSLYMASFDIENLFTNVPLKETISIILDQMFMDPQTTIIGLTRALFKNLLEISVLNSFFIFNGQLFKQIEGLGMGLPLSPTLANIFMCFREQQWLNDCPPLFKPVFYRRYMDDTFLLFRDPSHVSLFQNYLNGKHENITFTVEREENNKLPFLDILVTRENNIFNTSVFRKNSFSGLGTSYFSFTPHVYKINAIKTLIFRAYQLCSNYTYLHKEFNIIREYFVDNGFPAFLIYKYIRRFISSKIHATENNLGIVANREKFFLKLPFFGKQSDNLKDELNSIFRKYFTDFDIYICFSNNFTLKTFFPYKDVLPAALRSSLIYKFCCENCSHQYIGSTTRNLYMRVNEHAGKSIRTENFVSRPVNSSIRDHKFVCNTRITPENFKIIDSTKFSTDLRILESMYIRRENPKLNDMNSAGPLLIV